MPCNEHIYSYATEEETSHKHLQSILSHLIIDDQVRFVVAVCMKVEGAKQAEAVDLLNGRKSWLEVAAN
jgi:hypothetical protein